ncbi:MAG: OB-fold nucleic acid binding domain-containing protein, partial [Acidimicrobiales bacterium]
GPYEDFYDFCRRVDPLALNKRAVESLVKAGAFDSFGYPRKGLCLVAEEIVDRTLARRREEDLGISTLFSLLDDDTGGLPAFDDTRVAVPDLEFEKSERLAFEKEMLGLYVSDHPLLGVEAALRRLAPGSVREVLEGTGLNGTASPSSEPGGVPVSSGVVVGGIVTGYARRYTRRGELMGTFNLEDLESSIEVMVFPKTMGEYGGLIEEDAIVVVKARLDSRDEQPKLVAMQVSRPVLTPSAATVPVQVTLPLHRLTDSMVRQLRELVSEHPGPSPLHLRIGDKVLRLPEQFNVDSSGGIVGALKELFGAAAFSA